MLKKAVNMDVATTAVDNFDSICRTCMCDCKNVISFNVHGTLISNTVVSDILSKYASIEVSKEDELPKQICQQCFKNLANCYNFIDKCQSSENTLFAIFNQKYATVKIEIVETLSEGIKQEEKYTSDLVIEPTQNSGSDQGQPETKEQSNACKQCGETYEMLRGHSCIFKERNLRKQDRLRISSRSGQKFHKCSLCRKGFTSNKCLLRHQRVHTGEMLYKCSFCEKGFTRNDSRIQHELIHSKEKPYKCNFCEKRFLRKRSRADHEGTHTGEKRHKCSFCEKTFAWTETLYRHKRIHTGEKPYKCSFCERGFVWKDGLTRHERIHKKENSTSACFVRKALHRSVSRSIKRENLQTA